MVTSWPKRRKKVVSKLWKPTVFSLSVFCLTRPQSVSQVFCVCPFMILLLSSKNLATQVPKFAYMRSGCTCFSRPFLVGFSVFPHSRNTTELYFFQSLLCIFVSVSVAYWLFCQYFLCTVVIVLQHIGFCKCQARVCFQ